MNKTKQRIEAFFFTNKGGVRSNNEDGLVIPGTLISDLSMAIPESYHGEGAHAIFCVADGIGGEQKGEVAAQLVLTHLRDHYLEVADEESFIKVVYGAKDQLEAYVKKNPDSSNLGCTLAGVIIQEDKAHVFNIGDCRVYRINGKFFERITKDHSVVQHLLEEGVITEDEMRYHPRKNIVTSSISGDGIKDSINVWFKTMVLRDQDMFFICSDGIWECFSQDELEMIYEKHPGYAFCEKVLIASLARQSSDNVTAILLSTSQT
ncbi:protein phosphatase 2C domain-containing protein [Methanospirillum sp.]|uniref:PP2C family protein-serine/threonine phosphatase n=1 Tax=Methanospirillum sp. TaxID=45200 RepID=UPI002BBDA0CA|nr:protein phosphatase 2C domain-containing protein [Methanospirillum sp.]HPP78626.1 protein phosphatase 2C domain-containing protein [Methanospirillum sp.]